MIKIVDYGMGNLRSVQKAFEKLGVAAEICDSAEKLAGAEKLVLPGVGAFRDAIRELQDKGMIDVLREHVDADRPFLGICLGLQMLFDRSYEDGTWDGLGFLAGEVQRFKEEEGLKIPHMGWNQLALAKPCPLLRDIPDDAYFYFVHSYFVVPEDNSVIAARTEHGQTFVSMVNRGAMFATQFHPEKSQRVGLKLLENFATL